MDLQAIIFIEMILLINQLKLFKKNSYSKCKKIPLNSQIFNNLFYCAITLNFLMFLLKIN